MSDPTFVFWRHDARRDLYVPTAVAQVATYDAKEDALELQRQRRRENRYARAPRNDTWYLKDTGKPVAPFASRKR